MKRVCVNYFSYKGDQEILINSIKAFRLLYPHASFFVMDDISNQMDEQYVRMLKKMGVDYSVPSFNRGKNLNGTEAVLGILRSMKENCDKSGSDIAVKSDSDTFLMRPELIEVFDQKPHLAAAFYIFSTLAPVENTGQCWGYGMMYAMTRQRIEEILSTIELEKESCAPKNIGEHLPEDRWISILNATRYKHSTAFLCKKKNPKILPYCSRLVYQDLLTGVIANWNGEISEASAESLCNQASVCHFGLAKNGTKRRMKKAMDLTLQRLLERQK